MLISLCCICAACICHVQMYSFNVLHTVWMYVQYVCMYVSYQMLYTVCIVFREQDFVLYCIVLGVALTGAAQLISNLYLNGTGYQLAL